VGFPGSPCQVELKGKLQVFLGVFLLNPESILASIGLDPV
jgi:hypothetical protein